MTEKTEKILAIGRGAKTALTGAARAAVKLVEGQAKRRRRKRVLRAVLRILGALLLLTAGCFGGIHRRVILAWIRKEPLPEPPAWHAWCK